MIVQVVRNGALAVLAGWLLYQAQGLLAPRHFEPAAPESVAIEFAQGPLTARSMTIQAGRNAHFAPPTQGTPAVATFFSEQDVQNWKELRALGPSPRQDVGAATAAPGAEPALQPASRRSMTIPAGRNGHFQLDARVNGKTVRFMIDTGASAVILNRHDAKRIGLHLREHDFSRTAHTANGVVRWAPVVLRDLRVGALTLNPVEAAVNGGPLDVSLLGMSFLRRLKGYEVRNDRLVLYW